MTSGTEAPWTLWTVLRRPRPPVTRRPRHPTPGPSLADAVADLPDDVRLRGLYDVSAMRADADLMIWLTGTSPRACRPLSARCAAPPSSPRWPPPGP